MLAQDYEQGEKLVHEVCHVEIVRNFFLHLSVFE